MVVVTAGVVAVSSMASFMFARLAFRGRELVFNILMLGLLFPMAVAVLPLFITLRGLGLLDNLTGVIIVEIAFGLPANILLLRSFFIRSVPLEIEEASYVDGCGTLGFFFRVLLPMSRPAIAAVAVLTMVASWNAYFLPLLVLSDQAKWTLPLGISQYHGEHGNDWPSIMAFVTLSLVPTIVFYLFAERHLVAGLTAGAVKG
jgi:raffinose/stachyose/melibiose transport system permease protein